MYTLLYDCCYLHYKKFAKRKYIVSAVVAVVVSCRIAITVCSEAYNYTSINQSINQSSTQTAEALTNWNHPLIQKSL